MAERRCAGLQIEASQGMTRDDETRDRPLRSSRSLPLVVFCRPAKVLDLFKSLCHHGVSHDTARSTAYLRFE
jgi:hypothetical protein